MEEPNGTEYDLANHLKQPPNVHIRTCNETGLQAARDTFDKYPDDSRPTKEIMDLLEIQLRNKDLEVYGKTFHQVSGTAMGKPSAPGYANNAMARWEARPHELEDLLPEIWLRFFDDIFCI